MKKHVYLFFAPISPVAECWAVSGVSCDESKEGDKPVALSLDQLQSILPVKQVAGFNVPVISFISVYVALSNLQPNAGVILSIRPLDRGGFVVDLCPERSDAE